jgi:hypothetical protein
MMFEKLQSLVDNHAMLRRHDDEGQEQVHDGGLASASRDRLFGSKHLQAMPGAWLRDEPTGFTVHLRLHADAEWIGLVRASASGHDYLILLADGAELVPECIEDADGSREPEAEYPGKIPHRLVSTSACSVR